MFIEQFIAFFLLLFVLTMIMMLLWRRFNDKVVTDGIILNLLGSSIPYESTDSMEAYAKVLALKMYGKACSSHKIRTGRGIYLYPDLRAKILKDFKKFETLFRYVQRDGEFREIVQVTNDKGQKILLVLYVMPITMGSFESPSSIPKEYCYNGRHNGKDTVMTMNVAHIQVIAPIEFDFKVGQIKNATEACTAYEWKKPNSKPQLEIYTIFWRDSHKQFDFSRLEVEEGNYLNSPEILENAYKPFLVSASRVQKEYSPTQTLKGTATALALGQNVALLGPPNTGKTGFTSLLAMELAEMGVVVFSVPPIAEDKLGQFVSYAASLADQFGKVVFMMDDGGYAIKGKEESITQSILKQLTDSMSSRGTKGNHYAICMTANVDTNAGKEIGLFRVGRVIQTTTGPITREQAIKLANGLEAWCVDHPESEKFFDRKSFTEWLDATPDEEIFSGEVFSFRQDNAVAAAFDLSAFEDAANAMKTWQRVQRKSFADEFEEDEYEVFYPEQTVVAAQVQEAAVAPAVVEATAVADDTFVLPAVGVPAPATREEIERPRKGSKGRELRSKVKRSK